MSDVSIKVDGRSLVEAYARLKKVSVAKVLRNASRDFVQAAYKATPIAQMKVSPYYVVRDRNGVKRYIHESRMRGRTNAGIGRARRVVIARGWSKATWIGVMRQLQMRAKNKPSNVPEAALMYSGMRMTQTQDTASVTINDNIRFDRFGKSSDSKLVEIAQAGFRLAAERLTKDWTRQLEKEWNKL